jgi:hypothetical protein
MFGLYSDPAALRAANKIAEYCTMINQPIHM